MDAGSGSKDQEVWQSGAISAKAMAGKAIVRKLRSAGMLLCSYYGPRQLPAAIREGVAYVEAGSG